MSEMSADYVMQMSKSNSLQNVHSGKKKLCGNNIALCKEPGENKYLL